MKKCGRCSKPAVFHITELQRGEVQALHLCEQCAKEYLSQPTPDLAAESASKSGLNTSEPINEETEQRACPSCGITFKEFRAQGRLGCPHDYVVFQEELLPLIDNIHGETQHTGKVPKREPNASQRQYKLIRLRSRLKAAIEEEMYEEAAQLRDEIQSIENDLSGGGRGSRVTPGSETD